MSEKKFDINYSEKDILRFLTCGSVDDGKSTLIGRLLADSKRICQDTLAALKKESTKYGTTGDDIDYALLLDGLTAEREQGITIDVAYRYFETPLRKFIVADTPGHVQYTRNMVTGASTADLAIVLVDARNGLLTQSKRHTFIASLLQIPHIVVAINKMDLIGYSEDVFNKIVNDFKLFFDKLDIHDVTFIPVSALKGDNVVNPSENMSWFNGLPLLKHLEEVYISADKNLVDFRFPVKVVIRPNLDFRGYAGRVESGTISVGEEIVALPSGKTSTIKSIVTYDGNLEEAFAGQSVVLTLNDEIDISRGDMIVRKNNLPETTSQIDAMVCWMSEQKLDRTIPYILRHTSMATKAFINEILYKVDVNTLHRSPAETLELNDIARLEFSLSNPVSMDPYKNNRYTGSFILVDPMTNNTVAAGMIRSIPRKLQENKSDNAEAIKSTNITREDTGITLETREARNGHKAAVLWFTGLSGSGKSTIAKKVVMNLWNRGCQVTMLDGDNVRHGLCSDLGFSSEDREKNIRRVAEAAKLFYESGNIVICSFISPFEKDRNFARNLLPKGNFIEIYTKCSIDVCKRRDPKGLYKKAEDGTIKNFTGVSDPYEEPVNPEIISETDLLTVEDICNRIEKYLIEKGII